VSKNQFGVSRRQESTSETREPQDGSQTSETEEHWGKSADRTREDAFPSIHGTHVISGIANNQRNVPPENSGCYCTIDTWSIVVTRVLSAPTEKEMKKLFVGSLSWNTTDRDLADAFAKFGEITEAKVITDRDSGRSRGFGFVTFEDAAAADKAIAEMNGTQLDGREITVNEAQDKRRDGGGGRGGRGGGGGGGGGYGGGGRNQGW
jgi:cold-inducible RNA-binding protein